MQGKNASSLRIALRRADRGSLSDGGLDFEVFVLFESEDARHHVGGNGADAPVVVGNIRVEEATRRLDPVLCVRQFALKVQEMVTRLELGVSLGYREQSPQRLDQRSLGCRLPPWAAGGPDRD